MGSQKQKTLVILGTGLGGVPLAHYALKFTSPKVPNLKVVLVGPDTDYYLGLASPRAIMPGDWADKLFDPIAPAFAQYASDKFEFVLGKAEALDPDNNTAVVGLNKGGQKTIPYDTLIVATGSKARDDMPWKTVGTTEATRAKIAQLRDQVKTAKSVVVAGSGPTGVEIIGELGAFSAAGEKEITYIIDQALPLYPPVKDHIRDFVRSTLEKMKVEIINNTKVTSATQNKEGGTTLELVSTDGKKQTIKTDVYLPAFGVVPNTSFAPKSMLAADGRMKQTTTLHAEGYKNIFVVGDAGSLESPRALAVDSQVHHLGKALPAYFASGVEVPEYKVNDKFMLGLSIGKNTGTGQAYGMKLPSTVIWYMKSRYLGTDYYKDIVAGQRLISGKIKA